MSQAAASIVKGMDSGKYHIPTPDLGSNMLISSTMANVSPRMYPLLVEVLVAPVVVLVAAVFRVLIDNVVRKERRKQKSFEQ